MRPKRPSYTSPLTKADRPRRFTPCSAYPNLRHVGFTRLLSKYITRACGGKFHATPFAHTQTKHRAFNTASTPPSLLQQPPENTDMWNTE
jgi:hypothetical protein